MKDRQVYHAEVLSGETLLFPSKLSQAASQNSHIWCSQFILVYLIHRYYKKQAIWRQAGGLLIPNRPRKYILVLRRSCKMSSA